MSIATEIARLQQAKADLKASINAKGGNITDETIDEYASKVSALPSPKEEETKTITPDFSSGNVVVTPTSGKVLSQVTINKDSNLIADNIKKDITVHGITGNLQPAKEEETKTVTPNFSSGNQVITPTSGKVLSQVTLIKPADLLPENIKKDKNVCGVVGTSFIAIELTQAQYDALGTKDSNTYYLIVEE